MFGLPYVKGVTVIGSVGQGTPWPLSGIDLMIVTDSTEEDPKELIELKKVRGIVH